MNLNPFIKYTSSVQINKDYRHLYYIHSESLWNVTLDGSSSLSSIENNVPIFNYPIIGKRYNPSYIAWWGIINLNKYLIDNNSVNLKRVEASINWLKVNRKEKNDYIFWEYDFDWPNGKTVLKAPWCSGMSQALAASLFLRAYKISDDKELISLAKQALNMLNYYIKDGGLKTTLNGYDFYEEYPTEPSTCVLDGSLFITLACHDLYLETGDNHLFKSSMEGIVNNLNCWNYNNLWSYYGNFGYLSSMQYHLLNTVLLEVLFNLTNNMQIKKTVDNWKMFQDSILKKIFIFFAYYYSNSKYTLLNREELIRFIKRKLIP